MSAHKKKYRMGDGLPRSLACDVDGFERLKSTLRLNRHFCRKLLDSPQARKQINSYRKELLRRRMPSGERDRLLLFRLYGDPDFRRSLWAGIFDRIVSGSENQMTGMFPSLEHRILENHIREYDISAAESMSIDESFGEWPELVQHLNGGVPGADLAAHVWVRTRSRLNSWDSLNDEQRTDVTLVSFAVATIVDDERILHAVIKKVSDLETQFAGVLDTTVGPDMNTDENALSRWAKLCESLRLLAEKAAGPPPVTDALIEIRRVLSGLSEIEQPVREHCARVPFDRLMSRVNGLLQMLAKDESFSWIGETERTRLRARWEQVRPTLSPDQLNEEYDKIDERVLATADEIRTIRVRLSEEESRRRILCMENVKDLAARHSLEERIDEFQERILELRREQRKARIDLLSRLSPLGALSEMGQDGSASLPSEGRHRKTRKSVGGQPVIETQSRSASSTTAPAEVPPALVASRKVPEEPEAQEIKPDEILHDVVASTGDAGVVTHEPASEGKRPEPHEESGLKQTEPVGPSPLPEEKAPEPEGRTEGDRIAARAVKRMTDALTERSPRFSYAVHVARLMMRLGMTSDHPPVVLLEAALLSDRLSLPDGAVASELAKVLDRFPSVDSFTDADDLTRDRDVMLALAATLLPALLVPQSGAWSLLSKLKPTERLGDVFRFVTNIAARTEKLQGVRIDRLVLKAASSEADWKAECERLRLDAIE